MVKVSSWYGAFSAIWKASWNPTVYLNSLSNNPVQGKGLGSTEILFPFDVGLCTSGIWFHLYVQSDRGWTTNESHQPALQGRACHCLKQMQLQLCWWTVWENLSQSTFSKTVIIKRKSSQFSATSAENSAILIW